MKWWYRTCGLALMGVAMPVLAVDCEREDIDHYLDRGFTPQQVLELCRPEAAAPQGDRPGPPQDRAYWRDVIDAMEVHLDAEALSFRREQCVEYDRPNFAQQRKKACGKVYYRIALEGLEVLGTEHKLLYWGQNAVEISSSSIERRFELGQQAMRERDQALLARELESGSKTRIPVRDGVAVDVVANRLKQLAR